MRAAGSLVVCVALALGVAFAPPAPAGPDASVRSSWGGQEEERLRELAARLAEVREGAVSGAEELADEALELLSRSPDPELELRIRLDTSWWASRAGDVGRALREAAVAQRLAEELGLPEALADASYHLALAHWYESEHEAAIADLERAVELQEGTPGAEAKTARSLTLLGAIHRSRGELAAALEAHLAALELAVQIEDQDRVARARNNIGLIYWSLGEHDRARTHLERSIQDFRALGDHEPLPSALSNLGLVLIEMDEPRRGLEVLEDALALVGDGNNVRTEAKILSNMGFAHETLEQIDEALAFHRRALGMRERLGDHWGKARSLAQLGSLQKRQGRLEAALASYREAELAAIEADARPELEEITRAIAALSASLGDDAASHAALRRHVKAAAAVDRTEVARSLAEMESRVLLSSQASRLARLRLAYGFAVAGGVAVCLFGLFGWGLFVVKRGAHRELLAVHERLEDQARAVEEARRDLQEMRGVLPVCSYCRSVRDEPGSWRPLDEYLSDREGVPTSHGICPDCLESVLGAAGVERT